MRQEAHQGVDRIHSLTLVYRAHHSNNDVTDVTAGVYWRNWLNLVEIGDGERALANKSGWMS